MCSCALYIVYKSDSELSVDQLVPVVNDELSGGVSQQDKPPLKQASEPFNKSDVVIGNEINVQEPSQLMEEVVPILSAEQLLDEQDKTERNKLIISSHWNLLSSINTINDLTKNRSKAPSFQQLASAAQTIVQNLHIRNEIALGNIAVVDWDDLQILTPELVPEKPMSKAYISTKELKGINKIIESLSSIDEYSLIESEAWSIAKQIRDVAVISKDYSDGYYIEQIRKYLSSDEYSLEQKINFSRNFLAARDWELSKFIYQYFQKHSAESKKQQYKSDVQVLLDEIKQGFESQ